MWPCPFKGQYKLHRIRWTKRLFVEVKIRAMKESLISLWGPLCGYMLDDVTLTSVKWPQNKVMTHPQIMRETFYHVWSFISTLQSYGPKTKICVDMTLTSYLITDSYLGHEQSLYQMLKLVLLFPEVIFFNQLETEVIWTDCNDESCDYHYKLNCL